MRHRKKGKKIGRTSPHRKRTLQALSNALIENKQITTTVTKAKALRPFVEPLITRAKEDTEHNRREVFRRLQNKEMVHELFGEVAERVGDRPGGYTRIIQLGQRSGDGAELALMELVDYNDVKPADSGGSGGGGTRRGSGKGSRDTDDSEAKEDDAATDVAEEEPEDAADESEAASSDESDSDASEADEAEAEASESTDAEADEDEEESEEEK